MRFKLGVHSDERFLREQCVFPAHASAGARPLPPAPGPGIVMAVTIIYKIPGVPTSAWPGARVKSM